jgi:hypothetical protein
MQKYNLKILCWIFFLSCFYSISIAKAVKYYCPAFLESDQIVDEKKDNWQIIADTNKKNFILNKNIKRFDLQGAGIDAGSFEDGRYTLVPDPNSICDGSDDYSKCPELDHVTTPGTEEKSIWTFSDSDTQSYWIYCGYMKTNFIARQQLPKRVKSCQINYRKSSNVHAFDELKEISCEI